MKGPVDLYDSHYGRVDDEVYRSVRLATYGEDLGQASWITAGECGQFCAWLGIRSEHRLLEVACGSGGVSARIAAMTGAEVVGVDINAFAIRAAQSRPAPPGARVRPEFLPADADLPLPFPDQSFDFVFCNDSINHFRDRLSALRDWRRLLRPGGRCFYTDPVVVTGLVSNTELAARSSIGSFQFSARGVNEAALAQAGMRAVRSVDVTEGLVFTSGRWRDARQSRRGALVALEGESKFEELQRFLDAVHVLGKDRRLSRIAFVGQRVEEAALSDPVEALILDLLEWIGAGSRPYSEAMDAWRTSCPRFPVWEDATERGFIRRHHEEGFGELVSVTALGHAHLAQHRPGG